MKAFCGLRLNQLHAQFGGAKPQICLAYLLKNLGQGWRIHTICLRLSQTMYRVKMRFQGISRLEQSVVHLALGVTTRNFMYSEIKAEIQAAALEDAKMSMFHFQVLKNAHDLNSDDPVEFCNRVGVPESYATEFRKMLALAQQIRGHGLALS
jgi:hypothetical protein